MTLFATVDHAAGARTAGLEPADEVLPIPGNALVWSSAGSTPLAFHEPQELAEAYRVGPAADLLVRLRGLLDGLVAAADGVPEP